MTTTLRIATRESRLAIWQTDFVIQTINAFYPDISCEKILITTTGDRLTEKPLYEIGGKALFLKELEEALLENRADIAVHSMKDVPAILPDGLKIGAVMQRDNPMDAFVSDRYASFADLPPHAKVGTASLRRKAQLQPLRPDLEFLSIRGNINTRLRKMIDGEYDAIILAAAGLERLGMGRRIQGCFSVSECVPSVSQGVIGVEYVETMTEIKTILDTINHENTFRRIQLERIFQAVTGGNCKLPVACFIENAPGGYKLYAFIADDMLTRHVKRNTLIDWRHAEKQVHEFSVQLQEELDKKTDSQ